MQGSESGHLVHDVRQVELELRGKSSPLLGSLTLAGLTPRIRHTASMTSLTPLGGLFMPLTSAIQRAKISQGWDQRDKGDDVIDDRQEVGWSP
jgi:hypothetical protein